MSWKEVVAPTWGFKSVTEVNLHWGWGWDSYTVSLGNHEDLMLVALGYVERPETYETQRHLTEHTCKVSQLFWTGNHTIYTNPGKPGSRTVYPPVLTELKQSEMDSPSWPNWANYTVGGKVGEDGFFVGGPACTWEEMISGVEYIITEFFVAKWTKYYDEKEAVQAEIEKAKEENGAF